jgi:hypothetical protein
MQVQKQPYATRCTLQANTAASFKLQAASCKPKAKSQNS